ncbi:hypothetical protein M514_04205 [Trichuris suis]|uniref:Uncharacterized protein n=1 Tax=Trichuris suis TaxID=68888 RepID=A0A085MCS7_9BILA|nr:hypothetical protein M513_04205 [Trichuris suis]KFD72138.1 hypothetical protein M514_04205 [Trichuris suis]KHJ47620.1 hypothetical protein D918_01775 [Trichuris suis]
MIFSCKGRIAINDIGILDCSSSSLMQSSKDMPTDATDAPPVVQGQYVGVKSVQYTTSGKQSASAAVVIHAWRMETF